MQEKHLNPIEHKRHRVLCLLCRDWFMAYDWEKYCPACEESRDVGDTGECDHNWEPTHDDHMNLIEQCTICEQVK